MSTLAGPGVGRGTLAAVTLSKVTRRLVPFLIVCYFVAYLDRVNVGFAALAMNKDLGFSAYLYGLGASIFFFGYFIFEVPSNVYLHRVGARIWIARIMLTWGVLSAGMALVWNDTSFLVARFLLGAAEAGFFPGIILYFTYWYPAEYRARIIGIFMAAIPASSVIGSPVSGLLLGLDGALGIKGWQWLFICEGVPAILMSGAVLLYLTDRPRDATWLTPEERDWLASRLEREQATRESIRSFSLRQALLSPHVLALAVVYFGVVAANYGLSLWLPQIVKGFGLSNVQTGFVTAIPYVFGMIAMIAWGRHSDRTSERIWHVLGSAVLASVGLAAAAYLNSPILEMVALCFAAMGFFSAVSTFWTLPTALLSGTAAAAGIALINSIGNLSGFVGPYAVGWIKDATGDFSWGLLALAAGPLVSAIVVFAVGHDPALETVPER
jgi:ACS family tartrate transporter-like MFS transporter